MLWKIYFWLLLLHYVISGLTTVFALMRYGSPTNYGGLLLYVSFAAASVIGVWAYAFRRKLFTSFAWKIAFASIVLFDVYPLYSFLLETRESLQALQVGFLPGVIAITMFILTLPKYSAIYLYAWKSSDLWNSPR